MFRGSSLARVDDASGRFKIPEPFLSAYVDAKLEEFYITSEDGKKALIFPIAEWEYREEALSKLSSAHPARRKYLEITGTYGQMAKRDGQGRLIIPQMLREDAGLTGEVVVVGMMGKMGKDQPGFLEVVKREKAREKLEADPINNDDLLALAEIGF